MNTDIKEQIHAKTWNGDFWGPEGAIRLSERLYNQAPSPAGLSALSSTYYAASGNAAAQAKKHAGLKKYVWFFRSLGLYVRALRTSNALKRHVGLKGMTADQLDVRATILRRGGFKPSALNCIHEALLKDIGPDTEMLLLIGKADILASIGQEKLSSETFKVARRLARKVRPTTLVRYCKTRAQCLKRLGWLEEAKAEALSAKSIAEQNGLTDQIEKIQPILDELRHISPNLIRNDFVFPAED